MSMMHNLRRIASDDQQVRRTALVEILEEMACPFKLYKGKERKRQPQNIVVSFYDDTPRLVIGAHYDSVHGSTGANDNAAGVCILLEVIHRYLSAPPPIPVDMVFFDLEEYGIRGSKAYLDRFSPDHVFAFLNLDVCGVGDTITIAPRTHVVKGPLSGPIQQVEQTGRHVIRVIDQLPINDAWSFEQAGIPNITACILPYNEVDQMASYVGAMEKDQRIDTIPTVLETMHHGALDSIEIIEEEAMKAVLAWVLDVVEGHENGRIGE